MSQRPLQIKIASTDPKNITASDDAAWITGILGGSQSSVTCVLPFGDRLAVSKIDNNTVRMASGFFSMQGFGIKIPDSEDFTINSGAQGKKRIDLIVAEYRKGNERDSYEIKVIQGDQVASNPQPPTLTEEDLHFGGSLRQEEIARVILDGTEITSVAMTSKVIKGLTSIDEEINNIKSDYVQKINLNDVFNAYNQSSVPFTDFNSVVEEGLHYSSSTKPGHSPDGVDTRWGTLLVIKKGATDLAQLFFGIFGDLANRAKTNHGWQEWKVISHAGDTAYDTVRVNGKIPSSNPKANNVPLYTSGGDLKALHFIENGKDIEDKYIKHFHTSDTSAKKNFNLIKKYGLHYIGNVRMTNAPNIYYKYSHLLVLKQANDIIQQIVFGYYGQMATRFLYGETWEDWKVIPSISYGTSNPPTLREGEIYIKY